MHFFRRMIMAEFIEIKKYLINQDHIVYVQKEGGTRVIALTDGKKIPLETPQDFNGGDIMIDKETHLLAISRH